MQDPSTLDYSDATSENWVSAFDTSTGALSIDYSEADFDSDNSPLQVLTVSIRVTVSDPRSISALNSLTDDFEITFTSSCATDTLTLGANNNQEIEYTIGGS